MNTSGNRRLFLHDAAAIAGTFAASAAVTPNAAAVEPRGVAWPIGCFNRPWSHLSYDDALQGMKKAGFDKTGLLGDHSGELFLSAAASPDYVASLGRRIASSGLTLLSGWLRTEHNGSVAEACHSARRQIEYAATLGIRFLLTMGIDQPDQYRHFHQVMSQAADYASDRNIHIAMKPHGGCSATADEMLMTLEQVNHPNFQIWYDAGNIIHYTAADPVHDVTRVAKHVIGVSAKDCAMQGGDVMLQFGEGKVDFRGVFSQLKQAGFDGPVFVECCRGRSQVELIANSASNRRFLEELFSTL